MNTLTHSVALRAAARSLDLVSIHSTECASHTHALLSYDDEIVTQGSLHDCSEYLALLDDLSAIRAESRPEGAH